MPKDTKKRAYVTLELDPKLKAACAQAAKADGGRSLVSWIRAALQAALDKREK